MKDTVLPLAAKEMNTEALTGVSLCGLYGLKQNCLVSSIDESLRQPPFHLNGMHVMKPFVFRDWVTKHRPEMAGGRPISIFGAQFETEVRQWDTPRGHLLQSS